MERSAPVCAVQRERLLGPRHGRAIDRQPGIDELVLHARSLSASTVASLLGFGLFCHERRASPRAHREQPQPDVDRVDGVTRPARAGARREQQEGARGAGEIPLDTHKASAQLSPSLDRPEAHAHARGNDRDEGEKRARGWARPERAWRLTEQEGHAHLGGGCRRPAVCHGGGGESCHFNAQCDQHSVESEASLCEANCTVGERSKGPGGSESGRNEWVWRFLFGDSMAIVAPSVPQLLYV